MKPIHDAAAYDDAVARYISRYERVPIGADSYVRVTCREHGKDELVEHDEYCKDQSLWYSAGLHPRFSVVEALAGAKQTRPEIDRFLSVFYNRRPNPDTEELFKSFEAAIRTSKTPEEFAMILRPVLWVDLVTEDRTYRVVGDFLKKHQEKSFTAKDFLEEANQELRRLIVRAGPSMKEILAGLVFVCKDEEGSLYDDSPQRPVRDRRFISPSEPARFLHVVCPSTGQEYLLGVPSDMTSPKAARRWTFDLPEDAEFLKEA